MSGNQKFALGLIGVVGLLLIINEASKKRNLAITTALGRIDIY